jgi:hypothetical protein
MKKKILGLTVLAIIVAVAAINSTLSNGKINALSDLQLANVEALAQENGGGGTNTCGTQSEFVNTTIYCPDGYNKDGFVGIVYSRTSGNFSSYDSGSRGTTYRCNSPLIEQKDTVQRLPC